MQPAKSMAEVEERMAAVRKAYHDQFELVHSPKGFRAQHKVTGLSYQAHDITHAREQTLKDSHHEKRTRTAGR